MTDKEIREYLEDSLAQITEKIAQYEKALLENVIRYKFILDQHFRISAEGEMSVIEWSTKLHHFYQDRQFILSLLDKLPQPKPQKEQKTRQFDIDPKLWKSMLKKGKPQKNHCSCDTCKAK